MSTPEAKPLLTRADLPLDAVAEICRRWGVRELAVDPSESRPPPGPDYLLEKNPFAEVDLYLIADFGPGKRSWGFRSITLTLLMTFTVCWALTFVLRTGACWK